MDLTRRLQILVTDLTNLDISYPTFCRNRHMRGTRVGSTLTPTYAVRFQISHFLVDGWDRWSAGRLMSCMWKPKVPVFMHMHEKSVLLHYLIIWNGMGVYIYITDLVKRGLP
jgi:hypothetical protein